MFAPRRRRESLSQGQALGAQVLALFAAGEQGYWRDPSDFATMWQDSAQTTRVTGVGQPVGFIADKSPRANHGQQTSAGLRPVLQQDGAGRYYLDTTGGKFLVTNSIDFTATNKMTVAVGLRKVIDTAQATVIELSATSASNPGAFVIFSPSGPANQSSQWRAGGTTLAIATGLSIPPVSQVLVGTADIAAPNATLRINTGVAQSVVTTQGTGNFGNYPIYTGMRGGSTLPFEGQIYGEIVRGAASNAAQLSTIENFLNLKTGAF